jgi:hypothetical protein
MPQAEYLVGIKLDYTGSLVSAGGWPPLCTPSAWRDRNFELPIFDFVVI